MTLVDNRTPRLDGYWLAIASAAGSLQAMSYRASPTHINAKTIKTDANINTCIAVARHCLR